MIVFTSIALPRDLVPDFSDDSETDLDATSSVVPDPVRRPVRSTTGVPATRYEDSF